jgi:hypothetical protein
LVLADLARDLEALFGRAPVTPEQGRTNDLVLLVEKHRRVHLARQADRRDVARLDAALAEQLVYGARGRLPPLVGLLLGPTGPRREKRMGSGDGSLDLALRVDERSLDAARADVEPQEK